MRHQHILSILLGLLAAICQADLMQYASELPSCGLSCILGQLPNSACKVVTNETCVCTDTGLSDMVQTCILSACTVEEALSIERTQDKACNRPYRSRRLDLWAFIAVEVFALICISTRVVSQRFNQRSYGVDDYVVLLVLILFVPFSVIGEYARLTGFGVDMWTMDSETISTALKLFYVDETFYLAVLSLCKIAILCFFLRIFPNKLFRYVVYGTIAFVALSALTLIFLQIFQCMPVHYNWEGWKGTFGDHRCLDVNLLTYVAASVTIFQDLVILVLPIPLVLQLNTSWRKKLNIIAMFSLGIFILITSCIRLRYLVIFAKSLNPTWDYTDTIIWTSLEVNVSIVVVSLPAIRAVLSVNLPRVFGSTAQSDSAIGRYNLTASLSANHKTSRIRNSKFSSVFSMKRAEEDTESQLELGDRTHGITQTEIAVDNEGRDSTGSQQNNGIYVKKMMVWREEGGEKSAG